MRLTTCIAASGLFHIPLEQYTNKGDGASYKHMASAILGDASTLSDYDQRVFPGYPMLIAAAHVITRLPIPLAALLVTFGSAAIACAIAAAMFNNLRVGWAIAILYPHAFINFALPMSEAPMLAAALLGLLLARRSHPAIAGLLIGFAILIRPVACFTALGWMIVLLARATREARFNRGSRRGRMWIQPFAFAAASAAVVGIGMLIMRHILGSALHGVQVYVHSPRAYNGHMLTWPFASILWMLRFGQVPLDRCIYILAHVAAALLAILLLAKESMMMRRNTTDRNTDIDLLSLIWLSGNTAFILCIGLGPGAWGFNHFPRFMIPALPPFIYAWRRRLPRRRWPWLIIGAGLMAISVMEVYRTPGLGG